MDFYKVLEREAGTQRKPVLEVFPDFKVLRSKDLMIRGRSFYAIWDEEAGLWSTDEFDVQRLVDKDIAAYQTTTTGFYEVKKKYLGDFSSHAWLQFRNYVGHLEDHFHPLDERITFRNTEVRKEDYISRRLPYDLTPGDISAWDELVGTLYDAENRAKIEWAIGSIVSGDSRTIQKFLVFYGAMGTGKSTILNIIQWLFEGYFTAFVAKELASAQNSFALEAFKKNPLVAIEHDGDLSKIQDNTKLNSLVSHEWMSINEKNKPIWMARFNAMLMIGSNNPVKITDAKSGLIRRMIDIHPTGNLLSERKYQALMNQIKFELGAIAQHCVDVYREMGKGYYSGYRPTEMMLQTDVFYNFIEEHFDVFKSDDGITLEHAFALYKEFLSSSEIEFGLPKYKFREELKNYFDNFDDRATIDGVRVRSYYSGFNSDRFKAPTGKKDVQHMFSLVMEEKESLLDKIFSKAPAQYSNAQGHPRLYWDNSLRTKVENGKTIEFTPTPDQIVSTKLSDIDTSKEHYVKVPKNHIVIDFDLQDKDGKKSAERNLEAASQWPPTYAEFSKSGDGIHLHYNYTGDPEDLATVFDEGIEVKVYTGNSSLRRKLTLCNNVPVADISSGLPLKEKKVVSEKAIEDEKHLRALINKALRKEVHPNGTKPNVDYIHHVLEEAYASGQTYNVADMKSRIVAFAAASSNQAQVSLSLVQSMKFTSEDVLKEIEQGELAETFKSKKALEAEKIVIFDVEVFENLFVICWKYSGAPRESIVTMVNPTAAEVSKLMSMKLVGFFNRQYDNHILYGAMLGYDNKQLFKLSQKLISGDRNAKFAAAYNVSYTDIYDFASKKQSLKKWQIELGIRHMELGHDWNKPVPPEMVDKIVEYCGNDVESTDETFIHLEGDYIARQILADLSGLSMNSTTQQHTSKIIFGEDRKPQDKFVYTDLSEMFPGYSHGWKTTEVAGKQVSKYQSEYRGEITGEGGYVYAEPGMYENVAVLDVASMHPTSIEALNLFGEYTEKFSDLKKARIAIKRGKFDDARQMLGGKLARHLDNEDQAEALSYALKIVINIVYGLTSASFDNSFRDPRNIDNIVAKRGALFMIDLKYEVQSRGFQVVHIKTDSIKIPNATKEIIDFVFEFGAKYGYEFEHEATYSKFCLVNDAVYIAKVGWAEKEKKIGTWEAVGAQFQQPYVYKTLFSKEKLTFEDRCETKAVTTAMYLDYTGIDDVPGDIPMAFEDMYDPDIHGEKHADDYHQMVFIGKTSSFCPMFPGTGGGHLLRVSNVGKFGAVVGTSGYFWLESAMVKTLGLEKNIDESYFTRLVDSAVDQIRKYGDYEWFVAA